MYFSDLVARPFASQIFPSGRHTFEADPRARFDGDDPSIRNRPSLVVAKRKIGVNEAGINRFSLHLPNSGIRGNARFLLRQHILNTPVTNKDSGTFDHQTGLHDDAPSHQGMRTIG